MSNIILDGEHLTLEDVLTVAYAPSRRETVKAELSDEAWQKVRRAEQAVQDFIARDEVVYGVTTGFGAFKDRLIPPEQVQQLQRNILMRGLCRIRRKIYGVIDITFKITVWMVIASPKFYFSPKSTIMTPMG